MELRYWLAEALSGVIGPEVRLQGTPQFASQFGGGTFRADIMLGHLRTLDGSRDTAAIREVLSWTTGGKYTLVVSYGDTAVGEWLIWQSDPASGDGPVRVSGFELDGYPAFRSLNDDYRFSGTDQLQLASRLLRDAFSSYQDFEITVPWPSSGVNRAIDYRSHSAYYSDVLEEISAPSDGFQWRVNPSIHREDQRHAVKVTRQVEFGQPTIRRDSPIRLDTGNEDTRQGNLLAFPRPGYDFSKYAQSVYGFGRGEGAKQQWFGVSDPTLTNQGHLIVTKNIKFPNASTMSSVQALTRAALAEAQNLQEPQQAVVIADKVPRVPRVGDVLAVTARADHAWPGGFSGELQVGQVVLRPSGNDLQTIELLAI